MVKILTNPITGQAVIRTLTGLAKLGIFAATAILAQRSFNAAGSEFISETLQHYRQIKQIAA